jgi:hypothetical protein
VRERQAARGLLLAVAVAPLGVRALRHSGVQACEPVEHQQGPSTRSLGRVARGLGSQGVGAHQRAWPRLAEPEGQPVRRGALEALPA